MIKRLKFDIFLLLIFIIYIYMRAFVGFEYYWLHGDEARWLCVAKNFPKCFNNSMYIDHPLFYPFALRMITFIFAWLETTFLTGFSDLTAAMVLNFISSIVLFISLAGIARTLDLSRNCCLLILLFATMNMPLVYLAKIPFRETLYVSLFAANIHLFLLAYRTKRLLHFIFAGVTGGLLFITADITTVLLVPAYILGWLCCTKRGERRQGAISLILMASLFFAFVLLPRYRIYSTHTYYPAAKEGLIEKVDNFNLIQLIQPIYFARSWNMYKNVTEVNLDYKRIWNIFLTLVSSSNWDGITQRKIGYIEYIVLIVILLGMLKFKHIRSYIFLMAVFICALIPSLNKQTHPGTIRFVILAIIPATIFGGVGLNYLLDKIKRNSIKAILMNGSLLFALWSIIDFNSQHDIKRYSIFKIKKDVETQRLAGYINDLPKDGIMIEGHSLALAYTSNKRVVMLPQLTSYVVDDIELSIKEFDLNYIVLSDFPFILGAYKQVPPNMRYITENPSRFKLINTIVEEYKPNSNRWIAGNRYYVFEIQRDNR